MPFVVHGGIRVHYETEGKGPPLFLHHSLTRSLEAWRDFGYWGELKEDYRLIAMDARGHGMSDKPTRAEDYRAELMVGDVLAVLDALGISKTHFYGYSMGAMLGFRLAKYAPDRLLSLVLGGGHPYRFHTKAEKQFFGEIQKAMELGTRGGMEAVVAFLEKSAGPMPPEAKARVLANDPHALLAVTRALQEWPGAEDALPTITIPCMVYAGEADPFYEGARKCTELLPKATFISLAKISHTEGLYRSDLILPKVKEFLASATPQP